ncbi:MAG: 3'-5' exonuclease [Chromatiaceae bacterium]|nr:3'-5' exonuclease [Chromatiaceae bacterium]
MRFTVFAITSVPDTATTGRVYGLDDLDDEAICKVLFHRRKQQTGSSETLRWDQRAIAGITLIQHALDDVQMQTLHFASHSEQDMLQAYYRAVMHSGCAVSWCNDQGTLPLIRFRALMHGVSHPAYWRALQERADLHRDICDWLSPAPHDRPGLDETARKLGFPGLLGHSEETALDDWLQGQHAGVQAFGELSALNAYLLALRVFATTGEMIRHDNARVMDRLRSMLDQRDGMHLADFLAAWSEA